MPSKTPKITSDRLDRIAKQLNALPGDSSREVCFGAQAREATEQIRILPSATSKAVLYEGTNYDKAPYVIFSADITVNGVRFHAQWSRPATAHEIATKAEEIAKQCQPPSYSRAVDLNA